MTATRTITLGEARIPYVAGRGLLSEVAATVQRLGADRIVVISDATVTKLHGAALRAVLEPVVPVTWFGAEFGGEELKSISNLERALEQAVVAGATKRSAVIAFGGGVPGNLAGVVAGLLYRGVPLVHVPTTVMAATDSVLSLKQAVNSTSGKNHFGLYVRPEQIVLDLALLDTLDRDELRSGLCEAAKNCIAILPEGPAQLIARLQEGVDDAFLLWLLDSCVEAKSLVMARDTKETSAALVLEYGHTVGHAIEICVRGGGRRVSHGDAIAIGMLVAAEVSRALGYIGDTEVDLHREVLKRLGVRVELPPVVDVLDAVRADNKRGYLRLRPDEAAMVLLSRDGQPVQTDGLPLTAVPFDALGAAIRRAEHAVEVAA